MSHSKPEKLVKDFVTGEEFIDAIYRRLGLHSPIEVLKDCIKREEWFKGIVLATAFFEGLGTILLSTHFRETISKDKIENLRSVEKTIMFLFASELIDQPLYTKMIEVNHFRNDIVHLGFPTEPKLQPRKAEKTIEKAISCLQKLGGQFMEQAIRDALERKERGG